jgi:hypothetical protein
VGVSWVAFKMEEEDRRPCCVVHSATKFARHEHQESCPPILDSIAPRLFLSTFVLSDDHVMLIHFLNHYTRLGAWPNHTTVFIRARRSVSEASLALTQTAAVTAGVPRTNVRVVYAEPSDALKLNLMNGHIRSLPLTSWNIYADVDELFDYPCEFRDRFESDAVCLDGTMWDQVAIGNNITDLKPQPSLSTQYPKQCRIRAKFLPHVKLTKNILHRVSDDNTSHVHFRTTHQLANWTRTSSRCPVRGLVRHFTMTSKQATSTAQKARFQWHASNSTDPSRNYAGGVCGNIDTRTNRCNDYALLHKFVNTHLSNDRLMDSICPYSLQAV